MIIHSYNQFHAAGHGTFFSGCLSIENTRDENREFLWVYDCGSKRPLIIPTLITDMRDRALRKHRMRRTVLNTNHIGLLCISHFDNDHVNGLIELLGTFTVDILALPYLPFDVRLAIICNLADENPANMEAARFALDPGGYLALRGLRGRINRIVMVKGGGASAMPPGEAPPAPPLPRPGGEDAEGDVPRSLRLAIGTKPMVEDEHYDSSTGMGAVTDTLDHSNAGVVEGGHWEFVFFNKNLPSGRPRITKVPLQDVQKEIAGIVQNYELSEGTPPPGMDLGSLLRQCYDNHFGKYPIDRNDISLCVLSRPLYSPSISQCSLWESPQSGLGSCHALIPAPPPSRSGLLLTGDIKLDTDTLDAMKRHFGSRWKEVWVMQIPHHGSKHSWTAPIAAMCPHQYGVLCVPDTNAGGHHPHATVLADLESADKRTVRADYTSSIVYCFHAKR